MTTSTIPLRVIIDAARMLERMERICCNAPVGSEASDLWPVLVSVKSEFCAHANTLLMGREIPVTPS